MTTSEKLQIKERLAEYCQQVGSQNKASKTISGVSSATISQILNDNWELITDDMFRRVGAGIGYDGKKWIVVETRGFKRMTTLLNDTKENSLVIAVKGEAGCGKTEAIKTFAKRNENVYNLSCSEFWNRKFFMTELLRTMGKDSSGITVGEMMMEIVDSLRHKEKPVVILDEADKLNDTVLYFFISLYNQLEDHCGLVLCATDFLEKRVKRGVRLNKRGYKEIYSRIGRKFIEMQNINAGDISAVCKANGIEDVMAIKDIIEDSEGDLRRVKRRIHARRASVGNKAINDNTKN